jgi:hypothetical protein
MWVSVPLVRPVSEQRQCQMSLWWYRERRGRVFRSPSLPLNGWYHHNRATHQLLACYRDRTPPPRLEARVLLQCTRVIPQPR